MSIRYQQHRKFQENLGGFVIAFSEVEFALAELSSLTEDNLRLHKKYLVKHLGFSLDDKLKRINAFIKSDLPELGAIWIEQRDKIKAINEDRRYLAHGFTQYFLPREDGIVTASLRKKTGKDAYKIENKSFTPEYLLNLTEKLHHIKSGKNGIYGEFNTQFMTMRINKWNEKVADDLKIVYKINNDIKSDWRGKED